MKIKPLSKKILASITTSEKKTLNNLIKNHQQLGMEMILLQTNYTAATRSKKEENILRKMADKGFKAEYETFQAMEKLHKYMNLLHKKYEI
jgi:uncharacterized protein (UPF0210 family)